MVVPVSQRRGSHSGVGRDCMVPSEQSWDAGHMALLRPHGLTFLTSKAQFTAAKLRDHPGAQPRNG
jgi:hypothetical protein